MLLRSIILKVAGQTWLEKFVRNSRLTRGAVRRFIAGDTLDEAMPVAEDLVRRGFNVTLDLLGEHVVQASDGDAATKEYQLMLQRIAASPLSGGIVPEKINISIKLTQLGLLQDEIRTVERLRVLSDQAATSNNFVRIDMEDSACTDRTLAAAMKVFPVHKNIGIVLQSMLRRSQGDLKVAIALGMRVRLVKGAYLEPAEVAYQDKKDLDEAYIRLAKSMLDVAVFPAFGTHDEHIIGEIISYAEAKAIPKTRFEFQLLYGIRRDLQERLRKEGFYVRIYVPYGSHWYPYFTRRLAERPANLLFFVRSLFGK